MQPATLYARAQGRVHSYVPASCNSTHMQSTHNPHSPDDRSLVALCRGARRRWLSVFVTRETQQGDPCSFHVRKSLSCLTCMKGGECPILNDREITRDMGGDVLFSGGSSTTCHSSVRDCEVASSLVWKAQYCRALSRSYGRRRMRGQSVWRLRGGMIPSVDFARIGRSGVRLRQSLSRWSA